MATNYLNETYKTEITVDKVDLSFLGKIQLKDISILDHHHDSLVNVKNLSTSIFSYRNIANNKLEFEDIAIDGVNFLMRTYKGEKDDSFSIFTAKFDDENQDDSPSDFLLTSTSVHISDANFKIYDENDIDSKALTFNDVNGDIDNFRIQGPNIYGTITGIKFVENHGVKIENLTTNFTYTQQEMKLLNTTLETESSKVLMDLVFHRNGSFADFNNKVKFDAAIISADVSLFDLNKFYNEFGKNDVLHFSTKLSGTLNDFTADNLKLNSDLRSVVNGDIHVKNTFNTENGFSAKAKLRNLTSSYNHLKNLLPSILGKTLPSTFKELGRFKITGNTFITSKLIDAQVQMNSDLGTTISDLKLTNIDDIDNASYKGHIKIIDFKFGKFVNDSLIGKLSLDADIDGKGFTFEKVNTRVDGKVFKHQYKGYTYQNIDINGVFENKKFNGKMISNDENIKFEFDGLADLSSDIYKFNFNAQVEYADFNKLNLFKKDSKSLIKGNIDADFTGNSVDNLAGEISFKNASYTNQNDNYFFKDFNINSTFEENVRTIKINSTDIINGEVKGKFKFNELQNLTRNSIGSIYANYNPFPVSSGQYLDFNFKIYNKIVEVFYPEIILDANTSIRGSIDSDDDEFKLTLRSPKIDAFDNIAENIMLQIDNKNPLFNTQLSVDRIGTKYYDVSDLNLVNVTLNDTLFFRTEFVGGKNKTETFDLGFYHTIDKNNKSVVGMNKSNFKYKNTTWTINPKENKKNKVIFDNKFQYFDIQDFDLTSGKQKINLFGSASGKSKKDLNINFENVDLAGITPEIEDWNFAGLMNGELKYNQNGKTILPIANVGVEDFFVNETFLGNLDIAMQGKNSVDKFDVNVSVKDDENESLLASGEIDLSVQKPTIDMNVDFNKLELGFLDPIGGEDFSNIRGFAYGTTTLKGFLDNPDMNGELFLDSSGIAFPYLNVDYDFEGTTVLELRKQTFDIVDLTLHDVTHGTRGNLLGTISHKKFSDWRLDLNLTTKNLLVLDTKESEELYYGTGFIDGDASIKGFADNLTIDVNGKTNKGTYFVIPLSDVKTISNTKLVTFVTAKDDEKFDLTSEVLLEKFKGLSLNFDLQITKDAVVEMIMDKATGSSLKGSGTGDLRIEIDTKGKFNMFGDFVIDNGTYDFNYGLITKQFKAVKGGTVSWDGSPYTAELDIKTIYRVRANPKSILENITTSRDIPVDLIMQFTGELYDSQIEYDISIPDAGSNINAELDFKINQNNDKNIKIRHFGNLLAFGAFYNEDSGLGDYGSSFLSGTGEVLLSQVLTSILGGGNDNFQIGIDVDLGSDRSKVNNLRTEDQIGVNVATRINEKILINGSVGVPVGSEQQSVRGEVEVEFLLNDEGTLRSKVFNRQNEIQYTEEEEGYTQGVGLSYQFDFDSGKEFLEKIGLKKKEVETDTIQKKKDSIVKKPSLVNFGEVKKDTID